MDVDELMKLSVERALDEVSWESIEFLFKPRNQLELLLRCDFDGTRAKCIDEITDESPDAMPRRFRREMYEPVWRAIEVEEFYRALKEAKESQ